MIAKQHMLLNLCIFTFVSQQTIAMNFSKTWDDWKKHHTHQQKLVRHAWTHPKQPQQPTIPSTLPREVCPKVEQRFDRMIARNLELNHAH